MKRPFSHAGIFAVLATVLSITPLLAQSSPWIHIEVNETEESDSQVKVNLPLSVVEIALEAAPEKVLEERHIHMSHVDDDLEVEDLRRMWQELRKAGDAEIVSVQKKDQKVSIRRQGERVLIDVDDRREGDKVNVQVPVDVVDALFSGEGNELNIKDAVSKLKSHRGDVVRVDGNDAKVRIWIDERN